MCTEFDESDMYSDSKFMRDWNRDHRTRSPDMDDYMSYLEESSDRDDYESEKLFRSVTLSPSCINCHEGMRLHRVKHKNYYICDKTPECKAHQIALPECPRCGSAMDLKEGPDGRYLQCLRFKAGLREIDGSEDCPNGEKIEFNPCLRCGSPMIPRYDPNVRWECLRFPECEGSSNMS